MNSALLKLTVAATLVGSHASTPGQGVVCLDNSVVSNRVSIDMPHNPYSGTFGMEAWFINNQSPSLSAAIDVAAATNGAAAYAMLAGSGFVLESTYANRIMTAGMF